MSTALQRATPITENNIWKGATRLVLGGNWGVGQFPANLEAIIDLTTMALQSGYTDVGATDGDGFTIARTWDDVDGLVIDQRDFPLREGSVENVAMSGTANLQYTDVATLGWAWALGTVTTVAAVVGPPAVRAHKKLKLGTITDLTPRVFVCLQQNNVSGKMRGWAFRKSRVTQPGEIGLSGRATSGTTLNLTFDPDVAILDGSDFGYLYEET